VIEGDLSTQDLALVRRYISLNRQAIFDHWNEYTDRAELICALKSRLELLLPPVRLSLGDKLTDRARAHGDALAELKFRLAADGAVVFAKACELGLEGIVSKRVGCLYKSGSSSHWMKTPRNLLHPLPGQAKATATSSATCGGHGSGLNSNRLARRKRWPRVKGKDGRTRRARQAEGP
jgi:hypothetical protein